MLDEPHGPKRFLATAMPLSVSTRTSHISLGSRIPKSLVPVGFRTGGIQKIMARMRCLFNIAALRHIEQVCIYIYIFFYTSLSLSRTHSSTKEPQSSIGN